MKFKLLLLPKIFNNWLLKKKKKSVEKKQDDQVLARLMLCRYTGMRSRIRCFMWVCLQGSCWKLGAQRVASPLLVLRKRR